MLPWEIACSDTTGQQDNAFVDEEGKNHAFIITRFLLLLMLNPKRTL